MTPNDPNPWPDAAELGEASAPAVVAERYRGLGNEPYWFARCKVRYDPMFPRLGELVGRARHLLDLGCGYGVPAVWLLARQSVSAVTAVESDPERARVARWAIGERGTVVCSDLFGVPEAPTEFDRALLLDVGHYLSDLVLAEVFAMVRLRLAEDGLLVIRDTVPSTSWLAWERRLEGWRLRRHGVEPRFRSAGELSAELGRAGYSVRSERTLGREETWFLAVPR